MSRAENLLNNGVQLVMIKKEVFFNFILLTLFVFISAVISCNTNQPDTKEKTIQKVDKNKKALSTAPANDKGQKVWDKKCSRCHGQKRFKGYKAASISKAIKNVPIMRSLSNLSDDEIKSLGTLLSGEVFDEKYKYITAKACKTCHEDHYEQWRHSLHAKAHFESVYNFYFIKASMDTGQEIEPFCARCHTPIGVFNGSIPFPHPVKKPGDTKVSEAENDGVQCDFCHIINGYDELNNAKFTVLPTRTKFGPYKDSKTSFHDNAYSELHRSSELCGTCHNVNHPANGIVLEATYTEWKEGPYAAEGVICQDCHMTNGLVEKQIHPGIAGKDGPQRDHVSKHYFVGPNLMYSQGPEAAKLKALSEELLRKAAKVEIGDYKKNETGIKLPVMVTNTGAGHYIPTGVTEIREVWLEVKIEDEKGQVIFHTGDLDEKGDLKNEAIVYRTDVLDRSGTVTTQFWNTVKKGKDYRIPPRQTLTEEINVPLTGGIQGSLKVVAALKYRSVPPYGLREVGAPADLVEVPIFTMTEAAKTIQVQ